MRESDNSALGVPPWEPYGTIVGTIRKQLGTTVGTKMLARFVAYVATFRVAVRRLDVWCPELPQERHVWPTWASRCGTWREVRARPADWRSSHTRWPLPR